MVSVRIDLMSDTVTQPTEAMRRAMYEAEVGDDYYREDPTVRALEERAAALLGKEAALFVASGTMGNLVSTAALSSPGHVVVAEASSHILRVEGAHLARISGMQVRTVPGVKGVVSSEALEEAVAVHTGGVGFPRVRLLCIENTHNAAGGTFYTPAQIRALRQACDRHSVKLHVDGARIFNAAVAQGIPAAELARDADGLTFCLSKGLACPFGSLVVGDHAFVEAAREVRQMIGGGMRQAGIMAAAGLVALETMIVRLAEDHENARLLAQGLVALGFKIDLSRVVTNIVFIDGFPKNLTRDPFVDGLLQKGIRVGRAGASRVRMLTHCGVTREDIQEVLKAAGQLVR